MRRVISGLPWYSTDQGHDTLEFALVNSYIIGHNYHGHYLHAGGLSVNNYVRENKVREVNVRE